MRFAPAAVARPAHPAAQPRPQPPIRALTRRASAARPFHGRRSGCALPLPAGWVGSCRTKMAAGGSDVRAGDVEEDASQLIFPKGGPGAARPSPRTRAVAADLALPSASPEAWPRRGEEGPGRRGRAALGRRTPAPRGPARLLLTV